MTGKRKKVLAFVLSLAVLASVTGLAAVPAMAGGVCQNHTEHTEDCGYAPAEGAACTHTCALCSPGANTPGANAAGTNAAGNETGEEEGAPSTEEQAQPTPAVCVCQSACAQGAKNDTCPVCAAEGAVLEDCAAYQPPVSNAGPDPSPAASPSQGGSTVKGQALAIIDQPQDQTAAEGETATFVIAAEGEGAAYQWQRASMLEDGTASSRGDIADPTALTWTDVEGAVAGEYTFSVTLADLFENFYRCKVTRGTEVVYSNIVTVSEPASAGQRQNAPTQYGDFMVTVIQEGEKAPKYEDNTLTLYYGGTYEISMSYPGKVSSSDRIECTRLSGTMGPDTTVILNNVNIYRYLSDGGSAFTMTNDFLTRLVVQLVGENHLGSESDGCPGLNKMEATGELLIMDKPGDGGVGSLHAEGGQYAAGIGGGDSRDGRAIVIDSGIITAKGGRYASGIGGGGYSGDKSRRNGGTAGVTVNGGTVTATGHPDGGAGIGAGIQADAGVVITGGTIKATGGANSAGIGGSKSYTGDSKGPPSVDIKISGGNITAQGGSGATGIGTGDGINDRPYADIKISGGVIHATAPTEIGVGSVYTDQVSSIKISGGTFSGDAIDIAGENIGHMIQVTGGTFATNFGAQRPKDANDNFLYRAIALTANPNEAAAPQNFAPAGYGLKDVYTADQGELFFYLPKGASSFGLNGVNYTAVVDDSDNTYYTRSDGFMPVVEITDMVKLIKVGEQLDLCATTKVLPAGDTDRQLTWEVADAAGTGAVITGGRYFKTDAPGIAKVRAVVTSGNMPGYRYTQLFDISVYGSVVFTMENGSPVRTDEYRYEGSDLVVTGSGKYMLSGSTTYETVRVAEGASPTITFNNLNIDVSPYSDKCAFAVDDDAGTVTIKLKGTNVLKSGEKQPGIFQDQSQGLVITSAAGDGFTSGSLEARGGYHGAGIGGREYRGGNRIYIRGGTIKAYGGEGAAGIGGGYNQDATHIYISGGDVYAESRAGKGAGIGAGHLIFGPYKGELYAHDLYISGGYVKAKGNGDAAAIGVSGTYNNITADRIYISGGVVDACGGKIGENMPNSTPAQNIVITGGSIRNAIIGAPIDDQGSRVYKTTLELKKNGNAVPALSVSALDTDPRIAYGMQDVSTDELGKLYVYLPKDAKVMGAASGGDLYENKSGTDIVVADTGSTAGVLSYVGDTPVPLPAPDNVSWKNGTVASWDAVAQAAGYAVTLYRSGSVVGQYSTAAPEYDFTSVIQAEEGIYKFAVCALGDMKQHSDSPLSAQSDGYIRDTTLPKSKMIIGPYEYDGENGNLTALDSTTTDVSDKPLHMQILASDAVSGIAKVEYYLYRGTETQNMPSNGRDLDEALWQTYQSPVLLDFPWSGVLYGRVTDKAGNVSYDRSDAVLLRDPAYFINAATQPVRLSDTEAQIKLSVTPDRDDLKYKYKAVDSGALAPPKPDNIREGADFSELVNNPYTISGLTAGAKDLYLWTEDSHGNQSGVVIPIPAYAPAADSVQILTTALPDAVVGQSYQVNLAVSGAVSSWTFGQLPDGLHPAGVTGGIYGVPTTSGTYRVSITAKGSDPANTDTVTLELVVKEAASYSLTVSGGTGTGSYKAGTRVSLQYSGAVPYGHQVKWTCTAGAVEDENAANTVFLMPASAATVTATAERIPWFYKIAPSAGANGRIDPADEVWVNFGEDKTFTIQPNLGYAIDSVTADGQDVTGQLQNDAYTFADVTDDHTIAAVFKPATIAGVTVSPARASVGRGSLVQFSASVKGNGNYDAAVTWQVEGAKSAGTNISANGLLTVGADETADSLTVKAASKADSSKYGTAAVTVTRENTYKIVDGANGRWVKGSGQGFSMTADGDVKDVKTIWVDGKSIVVGRDCDLKSGSTIVTLRPAFLETLAAGLHTLSVEYQNGGMASAQFEIAVGTGSGTGGDAGEGSGTGGDAGEGSGTGGEPQGGQNGTDSNQTRSGVPGTGDDANMNLWIVLILAAGVSLIGILSAYLQKNRRR